MSKLTVKLKHQLLRKKRIRSIIHGTDQRPRLSVHISIKHVSAQLINDDKNITLVYATTVGKTKLVNNLSKKAEYVGQEIAKKALKAGYKKVVFDRNGKNYHGRIKILADAARITGLEF